MNLENEIFSEVIRYGKYARYDAVAKRRETWEEICYRNLKMHVDKLKEMKLDNLIEELYKCYEEFVIPKKILPSMRSMQFAGKSIDLSPNRMYNCAYMPIDSIYAFNEAMFLLLGGTGVGYSVQGHHIRQLPHIVKPNPNRTYRYLIGDSIEGWAEAVRILFESYTGKRKTTPKFDYSDIRPKGSLLKTSGGKAPGPTPLRNCLTIIEGMMFDMDDYHSITPIEAHDMMCHIADAVLAGGIRRAAMISLFSADDDEMVTCKSGHFWEKNPQRARANNSVVLLRHRIKKDFFNNLWKRVQESGTGEPGFYFTNDKDWGTNPCCEIALRPFQFCNLVEINASDLESQEDYDNRCKAASFIATLNELRVVHLALSLSLVECIHIISDAHTKKDRQSGVFKCGVRRSACDLNGAEPA